jgi:predicted RNA polymerase sigma factor
VGHFFRHEAGKMISTLTRIFGIEHLDRAKDAVQETLIRASQTWPVDGLRMMFVCCHPLVPHCVFKIRR